MSNLEFEDIEGYDPLEDDDYMCDKHLLYFKKQLLDWKQSLIDDSQQTIEHLRNTDTRESDPADLAGLSQDTAFELRTRDRFRKLIAKIDAALARIEDGTYGYCDITGQAIGLERLRVRPIATLCIEAQEKHERFERHHNDDVG